MRIQLISDFLIFVAMEKKLWILLLTAVAICSPVSSQDLHKLNLNLQRQLSNQKALLYYKDNLEVVGGALDELNKLWTVHFPRLLEEAEIGSVPNFTQKCIDSTYNVLEYESSEITLAPNVPISIPGPRAIPILDATGKQGAGLLSGNMILDGAYDECLAEGNNFTSFCLAERIGLVHADTALTKQLVWTMGLCVPSGCTAEDVALLVNLTKKFKTAASDVKCTDTKEPVYSAGAIIMLGVCAIFTLLILIGTILDLIVEGIPKFLELRKPVQKPVHVNENMSINSDQPKEKSPLLPQSAVQRTETKQKVSPLDFITAFSLYKTVPTLLATKQNPGVITSLNGLRVISMFWVILGHTVFWIFTYNSVRVDNYLSAIKGAGRFSFQAVTSAFFAVDSFFFLSGILVAYLTLRQMKKRKGKFPFLTYYIHRYLRLTPTYAFVLFFAWFLTTHLSYGPNITLHDPYAKNCETKWWTNLLYINNLYPWNLKDSCVGWTWYLANDMQFYVISPLILIPLYHFFPAGLIVSVVMLICSFVITSVLTAVYDFQANTFSLIAYNFSGNPTSLMTYSDAIYIKPWNRLAPYLVGLVLGYIFYRGFCFGKLHKVAKLFIYVAMWCLASFVLFWLVYVLYFTWHGHIPGKFENNIYITFSRFLWAVCLAAIVFACHNGYGFFVNSFLSMPMWTPLARMTFNAYLVHPIVLSAVYGQLQDTIHFTDITIACYAVAFTVVSYGAALVVCLGVEFPLGTIETLVFTLFGAKGRESQRQGAHEVNLSLAKGELSTSIAKT